MQIEQIIVRPGENTVIVQYSDSAGRRSNNLVFDSGTSTPASSLVAECQQKLPPDTQHPNKTEVEQEIEELEYRLQQLKLSIGQA